MKHFDDLPESVNGQIDQAQKLHDAYRRFLPQHHMDMTKAEQFGVKSGLDQASDLVDVLREYSDVDPELGSMLIDLEKLISIKRAEIRYWWGET